MQYDAVIILGSRPKDPKTWALPSHVYASLDRAARLYEQGAARYVIVSGKWTINFDVLGIQQPFTECDAMAEYLLKNGVPDSAILREDESKDLISNFYYVKRLVLKPNKLTRLHFIAAEARLKRIAVLSGRILGPDYTCSFEGVDYDPADVSPNEVRTLRKQTEFLKPMADGDDDWLTGKFFDDPFYQQVKQRVRERAANEPFLHLADPKWQQR